MHFLSKKRLKLLTIRDLKHLFILKENFQFINVCIMIGDINL